MSIPGHHHKVVFIGDVRKIDTDGSGAVIGVILMLDADEPCDVSIMFPAARPGVLIGNTSRCHIAESRSMLGEHGGLIW
jgi:hypothetical protein